MPPTKFNHCTSKFFPEGKGAAAPKAEVEERRYRVEANDHRVYQYLKSAGVDPTAATYKEVESAIIRAAKFASDVPTGIASWSIDWFLPGKIVVTIVADDDRSQPKETQAVPEETPEPAAETPAAEQQKNTEEDMAKEKDSKLAKRLHADMSQTLIDAVKLYEKSTGRRKDDQPVAFWRGFAGWTAKHPELAPYGRHPVTWQLRYEKALKRPTESKGDLQRRSSCIVGRLASAKISVDDAVEVIASSTGLSEHYVGCQIRGTRSPTQKVLEALSTLLGVPVIEVVEGTKAETPAPAAPAAPVEATAPVAPAALAALPVVPAIDGVLVNELARMRGVMHHLQRLMVEKRGLSAKELRVVVAVGLGNDPVAAVLSLDEKE